MNFANKITLSRTILGPLFLVAFSFNQKYWSLIFLFLNSFGDLCDGVLARRRNEVTEFGELLDPFVDLLFFLFVGLSFSLKGVENINWFFVPIIFFTLSFLLVNIGSSKIKIFHTKFKYLHSPFLYALVFVIVLNLDFKIIFWLTFVTLTLSSLEVLLRSIKFKFSLQEQNLVIF